MDITQRKAKEVLEQRIFTISNFISVFRVLLLPPFWFTTETYAQNPKDPQLLLPPLALCLLAVISDWLDGFLARKLHQETTLGRYLDPVCDKLVTITGLLVTVIHFHFPLWILILYTIRELLGVWLGGFLYFKRGLQGHPNWWGKMGVGIVAISVAWHMLIPYYEGILPQEHWFFRPEMSSYLLVVVLAIGAVAYIKRYWWVVLNPEKVAYDPSNKKDLKKYRKV